MPQAEYSLSLCQQLIDALRAIPLHVTWRPARYETGGTLDLALRTAWPETEGHGRFRIDKFVGGGFAGQVYRCRLEAVTVTEGSPEHYGLRAGGIYAVKILVPPSRFAVGFRNAVYWLGFQGPFTAQTNAAACRTGLLWPKLLRIGARQVFGREDAIADTYASFYDAGLRAYGEIREWVEGRTWRLEADTQLSLRRDWRTLDATATGSPEFVAKRQFMARLVDLLHTLGAPELARQYAWWTCKSQPNALRRFAAGPHPGDGLTAVDFRAGLALLPYLPMSPGDVPLILRGLRRGSLVQFDRCDFARLRAWLTDVRDPEAKALVDALETYDRAYRAAMPDLTHQGLRLLRDANLRASVRRGLAEGYYCAGLVDEAFRERLATDAQRFAAFYVLGAIPFLGAFARRLWGDGAFRRHVCGQLTSLAYLRQTGRARAIRCALTWHRAGRVGERHARLIADHVPLYWLEQLTLGLLPRGLHRLVAEPATVWQRVRSAWLYLRRFLSDGDFRAAWLREQIASGYRDGMLTDAERDKMLTQVDDPFIAQYLKSVGVHLATLPVTQVVSVTVGAIVALRIYLGDGNWQQAGVAFGKILLLFQVIPISPGSLCRGLYVVYLMVRDRNFRDYMVAAPLSFVKYIGYLAFPLQMAAAYPELSQFMAGRWATGAVHIVPVFGEKGALLEHAVFDMFFNHTRAFGRWAARHTRGILDAWLALGTAGAAYLLFVRGVDWSDMAGIKTGVNVILGYICVFFLPRTLFYPLLRRRPTDK
jgi:hypothetical protein